MTVAIVGGCFSDW